MQDYETLRQKHVAALPGIMFGLVQRLKWSREQIDKERTAGLRRILAVAREKSAWHRQRLQHLDIDNITLGKLTNLPPMTKDELMSSWDDIVTDSRLNLDLAEKHLENAQGDAYLLDEYHVVASGGSSGRRGVFVWGWDAWAMAFAGIGRWRFTYGQAATPGGALGENTTMAMVAAEGATHMTSAMTQTFTNPLIEVHRFSVMRPMTEIVEGLNALQPASLVGYASILFELAHEARAGRLRIEPKTVVPTAEPLLPEMRKAMEEAWGVPVGGTWGTSEACCTGQSCFYAGGMHLAEDLMIVEPVDAEGRAVKPGELSSKIFLTNLMNPLLPLIRYEITDQVRVLEEPCPCGSLFARVDDIEGRMDDIFRYDGGVMIHPHVFRSPLSRVSGIVEYQVRQTPPGADVTIRTVADIDADRLQQDLVHHLDRAGLDSPVVTVERVDSIERTAAGKLKRFVAL